jgi:hypothetical protein
MARYWKGLRFKYNLLFLKIFLTCKSIVLSNTVRRPQSLLNFVNLELLKFFRISSELLPYQTVGEFL